MSIPEPITLPVAEDPEICSKPLGQLLIEKGVISQKDLERALELQKSSTARIGTLLLRSGALSEQLLLVTLSEQLAMPVLGREVAIPAAASIVAFLEQRELSLDWCLDQQVVVWQAGEAIYCATNDPLFPPLREALAGLLPDMAMGYCLAPANILSQLLEEIAPESGTDGFLDGNISQLRELAEEAPIVELVSNLIAQAIESRASDIHVEPEETQFHVRYRIDGVLVNRYTFPADKFQAVVSRLKLISGIDIAERRLPQDGRMSTRVSGVEVEIRVSTLPGANGESVVMRLLPKARQEVHLQNLGMLSDHLAMIRQWVTQPNGIILVTGPTGSGKSTTLYAALDAINDGVQKIITVEDPVEFKIPGITQVQAHADIGLTFASALRSILRQDPDVIMIGEIRDLETAEIAVQAALTGHLVFSTLHTNDSVSAFTRLIDMGIEPFLVANPIKAVQAQRLVRQVCSHCSEPYDPPGEELREIEWLLPDVPEATTPEWRKVVGCDRCNQTGFRGRAGIYEMVTVTEAMQELIVGDHHIHEMKALAKASGFRTLREDGLLKAYMGITTIEEVLQVTRDIQ